MSSLLSPIKTLKGVGSVLARKFNALGIDTLQDALWFFPLRHEDWRHRTTISALQAGQDATLLVHIVSIITRRAWRRRGLTITEARVSDDSGAVLPVIWFNMPYLAKTLKVSNRIYLSGSITAKGETLQMVNPSFERPSADPTHEKLVPIYRSVEGLSQRQIRLVAKEAVTLARLITDPLPQQLAADHDFLPLDQALSEIHFPTSPELATQAVRRLKFDELLRWQISWQRDHFQFAAHPATIFDFQELPIRSFVQSLPFELTSDQRVAAWQIIQDMAQPRPMSRLLQGDVGSGKTAVAAIVAYNVILHHHQVALLAPTVVLAEQHWQTLSKLFHGREVTIASFAGGMIAMNTAQKKLTPREFSRALATGEIDLVVGTHALLTDQLRFANLGLVLVDEQQRFGVNQRDALLSRYRSSDQPVPHFLSLTATPIPRTLALFVAGELAVTTIAHKPAGRGRTASAVVGPDGRARIDEAISTTIARQEQAFVITPLIEESDHFGARAAMVEFERLKETWPRYRIGLIHGSMPAVDRLAVLTSFRDRQLDIVVSTTVLEVGVDVPNATLMVIEGADRFGLAQLHQLRGRVGRAEKPGLCIFATDRGDADTLKRLAKVAATEDGFLLAEMDLAERGGGELYGLRQSGLPDWRLATLQDADLLKLAHDMAVDLVANGQDKPWITDEIQVGGRHHRE